MTNDGNCILREVDVSHPAAKSMIELSRAQDEEVGDGTTSVIILSTYTHSHLIHILILIFILILIPNLRLWFHLLEQMIVL